MKTMSLKVGSRIVPISLDKCTDCMGGSGSPYVVKREPSLETELVRFDKYIRLNGTSGPFSDMHTRVTDVESKGKDIVITLGFVSITGPTPPPFGTKVFDHFVVSEDNGNIVVFAKEDEENLPPEDRFKVIIRYEDEDENISQALDFSVTDRIDDVVYDAGSDAVQWFIRDMFGNTRIAEPLKEMLYYFFPSNDQEEELYDQCEDSSSKLINNLLFIEDNKVPFTQNQMLDKPSDTGVVRCLTRRDDSKKGLLMVPNYKILLLKGVPFGNIKPLSIYLKRGMLSLHTICASCQNQEKEFRPLALNVYLQTPNILSQKELTMMLREFNILANDPDFLSQYGLKAIEIRSISESDCDLFHFVAASKVNYNGRFMVINIGRSTRDWSVAVVKNNQITVESRGGDMKAGNQDNFAVTLELITAIALYGKDRTDQMRKVLTAEPYLLNKIYEIAEKMKREYKSNPYVMPLNLTDDPSKLTVEKILEIIETIGEVNDTYGIISQMIDRNLNGLEDLLKEEKIQYLLLSGRSTLFPPLYDKIVKIAKSLNIKVFRDNDPYRLKSASMYGALSGYQKEYNMVGFPAVKNRQRDSEPINKMAMKIIKLLGDVSDTIQSTPRVFTQNYQSNYQKAVYDEEQLKSGGVLIPYSDDLMIEVNGVEYRQSSEIIKAPKGQCFVSLSPDGDFYLRCENKQSKLVPVVLAKGTEDLLETLFPWSLKLTPSLSLDNLPEAKIKR